MRVPKGTRVRPPTQFHYEPGEGTGPRAIQARGRGRAISRNEPSDYTTRATGLSSRPGRPFGAVRVGILDHRPHPIPGQAKVPFLVSAKQDFVFRGPDENPSKGLEPPLRRFDVGHDRAARVPPEIVIGADGPIEAGGRYLEVVTHVVQDPFFLQGSVQAPAHGLAVGEADPDRTGPIDVETQHGVPSLGVISEFHHLDPAGTGGFVRQRLDPPHFLVFRAHRSPGPSICRSSRPNKKGGPKPTSGADNRPNSSESALASQRSTGAARAYNAGLATGSSRAAEGEGFMKSKSRFAVPLVVFVVAGFLAQAAQAAVVRGEIRKGDGATVPEALVGLVPVEDRGGRITTASNRAGAFLFAAIRPGRYEIHVEVRELVLVLVRGTSRASGGGKEAWNLEQSPTPDTPVSFEVSEGQDIEFVLTVDAGLTIGGKILTVDQALDAALGRIRDGDCSGAIQDLEALVAASPDVPKAHYLLGYCQGTAGNVDGALLALDRALQVRPDYPGANLLKAQILSGAGSVDAAEAAFRKEIALAERPRLVCDAWWGLGLLLRDAGRVEPAVEAFEQAASAAPGKPEAWVEVAEIRRSGGDLDAAEAALGHAAEGGAPVAKPLLNLGVARFNDKQFDAASRVFRRASEADGASASDAAMAYGLLGKSLLAAGRKKDAVEALERSIEIAPAGDFAPEAKKLLEEARR